MEEPNKTKRGRPAGQKNPPGHAAGRRKGSPRPEGSGRKPQDPTGPKVPLSYRVAQDVKAIVQAQPSPTAWLEAAVREKVVRERVARETT